MSTVTPELHHFYFASKVEVVWAPDQDAARILPPWRCSEHVHLGGDPWADQERIIGLGRS